MAAAVALAAFQTVGRVIRDGGDGIYFAFGEIIEFLLAKAEDATAGVYPEITIIIFKDIEDDITEQSLFHGEISHLSILQAIQPTKATDPEASFAVFVN